jgi:hypothetical protein
MAKVAELFADGRQRRPDHIWASHITYIPLQHGWEAEDSLGRYVDFYCNERLHQALSCARANRAA